MGTQPTQHIYAKPYKSVSEQLSLLEGRGMHVSDRNAAMACLERVGYYRLSGYWYPLRKSRVAVNPLTNDPLRGPKRRPQVVVEDEFWPGATFQTVMDLYVFDKRLRLQFLDAIERVEIALRVDVALLMGARGAWAYREKEHLSEQFARQRDAKTGLTRQYDWLARMDKLFDRSREEFAGHFKAKYAGDPPPIWIAIEFWDFGMLSVFLNGMKLVDQEFLAHKYGLPRAKLLTSLARNINHARNVCAHHSRLWNKSPADQISPPLGGEVGLLDHIATSSAASRFYATAAILQFLLRTINPASSWGERLKELCTSFPDSPYLGLRQAGFPVGWDKLPLWQQAGSRPTAIRSV